ncbi:MAG: rhodopsin [Leptolyngbya sp.]|nr:MAG: rhodopsin [Leptolyngbya sp.]
MAQTWLWIGVGSMALGAAFFGYGAHRAKTEGWRKLYTLSFFICLIASVLYLAMALGQGQSVVNDRPTVWVRYITWSLSTPLLLLIFAFLGHTSLTLTGSLLGTNALMIATGLVAALSPNPINYIWYVVSCAAYLAAVYLLLVPFRREAERNRPRTKKFFGQLVAIHLILWTAYPIVWILAPTGLDAISQDVETMFYTILDISSKVGFGLISLNTYSKIEHIGATTNDLEPTASLR